METTLLYIGILIIASLTTLLVGVIVSYLILVSKYIKLKEDKYQNLGFTKLFDKTLDKLESISNTTRLKTEEIIKDSENKFSNITRSLEEDIRKTMQFYSENYRKALENSLNEAIRQLQNIPEVVNSSLNAKLTKVSQEVDSGVSEFLMQLRSEVSKAYKKIEDEVDDYKIQRLKQVDETIITILQEIARKVLSREINQEEHEKLVMRALEEAKMHHIFSDRLEDSEGSTAEIDNKNQ